MPTVTHGHISIKVLPVSGSTTSERFLKHRLKYDHGAVSEVSVHLEANVQRLVLILVDGHSVYQHSEIRIGYAAFG